MSRCALGFDKGKPVLTWNDLVSLQGGGALAPAGGGESGSAASWEQLP